MSGRLSGGFDAGQGQPTTNFQSIVPVSTSTNSPGRLCRSPLSSPGQTPYIFGSKGLIFHNFFSSVMWMVTQVREKQILIF